MNLIRKRWNNNFTVQGPLDWIDMKDPLLSDPAKLNAYLEHKRLNVVLLSPWLDYDPGRHDQDLISRGVERGRPWQPSKP